MRKTPILLVALAVATSGRMAGILPGGFRINPGFSCQGREFGFYADVENGCSAYHICNPVYDEAEELKEMAHFTFLCGPGTVFDQFLLACAHPKKAFPCEDSQDIYDTSNFKLRIDWEEHRLAELERYEEIP